MMLINTEWLSGLARSWVRFHYPHGDITRPSDDWHMDEHIAYCEKLQAYLGDVWERHGRAGRAAAAKTWHAIFVDTLRSLRKQQNVYGILYSTPALRNEGIRRHPE